MVHLVEENTGNVRRRLQIGRENDVLVVSEHIGVAEVEDGPVRPIGVRVTDVAFVTSKPEMRIRTRVVIRPPP